MSFKDSIDKTKVPTHVAIIMDGNGRWAAQRGEDRFVGHQKGAESVREALQAAAQIGVKYLTLYAFSLENWSRPKEEVDALMGLLVHSINVETKSLKENNVRLHVIGNIGQLPAEVSEKLNWSINELKDCTGVNLVLALSYGSQWEIVEAVKKISEQVVNGELSINDISVEILSKNLTTKDIPDPDLLIRTSGELRISNFLLWQIAYSELYFTSVLWPDFSKENFFEAVCDYQNRQRRYGKTSQQIED